MYYPSNSDIYANFAKIEIKDLVVEGVQEDLILGCKKCIESFSKSGSKHCKFCRENKYYDAEKVGYSIKIRKNALIVLIILFRMPTLLEKKVVIRKVIMN